MVNTFNSDIQLYAGSALSQRVGAFVESARQGDALPGMLAHASALSGDILNMGVPTRAIGSAQVLREVAGAGSDPVVLLKRADLAPGVPTAAATTEAPVIVAARPPGHSAGTPRIGGPKASPH